MLPLTAFLERTGMQTSVDAIRREHVEVFVADLLGTSPPPLPDTQGVLSLGRRRGGDRGVPDAEQPIIPETPVSVLSDDEIKRLLKACDCREFVDRRDLAILCLFIDSGLRRAELANLNLSDVDLDVSVVVVLGKGRGLRSCVRTQVHDCDQTVASEPGACTR